MKKLRLLLIVGCANDIFIYNFAKWLKAKMDISIDVFEFYPSDKQKYDDEYYDNLITVNQTSYIRKNKYLNILFYPFYGARELDIFLKNNQYDIIHCHLLVPPLVLSKELLKCKAKKYLTFWGREYINLKILFSQKFYKCRLDRLVNSVDYVVNDKVFFDSVFKKLYPNFKGLCLFGKLGAASLDFMYDIFDVSTKSEIKENLGISRDKYSVLIGYSGKTLHQHIEIIRNLEKNNSLKSKIHLLAPMTRGASKDYTEVVESALLNSGFSYTLIKERFLSDKEIAELRIATDIVLQLSTTDAFSRSILECLCAKSLMIYGEWLNYDNYLESENLWAMKVSSIEDAMLVLQDVICKYDEYICHLEANSKNGKIQNLWSFCINDWIEAYKKAFK